MTSVSRATEAFTPTGAPRRRARRLVAGRGEFTGNLNHPALLHACFVRSPYAHARIAAIDVSSAVRLSGCVAVLTGRDIAKVCRPFQGVHASYPALEAPLQHALAIDIARWQGEPVAIVVAESRAGAEDAAELVEIDWQEMTPIADPRAAIAPDATPIHDELESNLALELTVENGDPESAFAEAAEIVEDEFVFSRHTGVPLEPRCIVADFDPSDERLTVHQSHQTPFQMQDIYARLLGVPEHRVRVVCPDVGGGFGIKQQLYGDELAVCAATMILARPVKYVADRLESFLSDIHAREHRVSARMAVDSEGRITAMSVEDLFGIGPYSQYPRSSVGEGNLVLRLTGAPYRYANHAGRMRMVYQNKPMVGHYRAVGHPIACAVAEALADRAASAIGLDPIEFRRRNIVREQDGPRTAATGMAFPSIAIDTCLERVTEIVDFDSIRRSHAELRLTGIHRGIGLALFIDLSVPGSEFYGRGDVRVSSQDGCVLRLEPSGVVRCLSSVTDQGQGTADGVGQLVAETLGVALEDVEVVCGDSEASPYGGGAWASRGIAIAGEAAQRAASVLKRNILKAAGLLLQSPCDMLDISEGWVVMANDGRRRMALSELAKICYFQQFTLPDGFQPQLIAARQYVPSKPVEFGSGVQVSEVDVDIETGMVRLLRHVVVAESGRIINPLIADDQIRGGVVQGIGSALYEECRYDDEGQLQNGTLADYLLPMAAEMPDIEVHHVQARTTTDRPRPKGIGESGTGGAQGAILNAVNDAIGPYGGRVTRFPITPQVVLAALNGTGSRYGGIVE